MIIDGGRCRKVHHAVTTARAYKEVLRTLDHWPRGISIHRHSEFTRIAVATGICGRANHYGISQRKTAPRSRDARDHGRKSARVRYDRAGIEHRRVRPACPHHFIWRTGDLNRSLCQRRRGQYQQGPKPNAKPMLHKEFPGGRNIAIIAHNAPSMPQQI